MACLRINANELFFIWAGGDTIRFFDGLKYVFILLL